MKKTFSVISACLWLYSGVGHAAACCGGGGGGGDDPVTLGMGEKAKVYVGVSKQSHITDVFADGSVGTGPGPTSIFTLVFAGAAAINDDLFATTAVPYVMNFDSDRYKTAWGDGPSFGLKWTLRRQTIKMHYLPQVQLSAGYKFAHSKSAYTTQDPNFLDVVGTGFDEARVGLDLWSGQTSYKWNFNEVVVKPQSRVYGDIHYQPGMVFHTLASIGHDVFNDNTIAAVGASNDFTQKLITDGNKLLDSEIVTNSVFTSLATDLSRIDNVRFSVSKKASFGGNKNTNKSLNLGLGYSRAF